jgi:spermidine synthase
MMDLWYSEKQENGHGLTLKVTQSLYSAKSDFQQIDIVDTEAWGRLLLLDGLVMTTERDEFIYHEMISHIPLLAHPDPKQVLIIGGGDGGTVREVLKHPGVQRVVLCEIDGQVVDACRQYLPSIAGQLSDARVDIQIGDGVAYIERHTDVFDVILVDSTDPMGPGEGLFTEPFYQNVKRALTAQGVMAAQTESPFVNQTAIRKIYDILNQVFPRVDAYTAPIPTYPGGYWCWTVATKRGFSPFVHVDVTQSDRLSATCKYYNADIHTAAFALPNFLRQLIAPALV